jgi:hypothetical protein
MSLGVRHMGKGHASTGGWSWAARGADAKAGRRAVRGRARHRGAVVLWPGRVAGPLFEHVFLQNFVMKCIK